MTRDQAIVWFQSVIHPDVKPEDDDYAIARATATNAIDGFMSMGLLPLDDVHPVMERVFYALKRVLGHGDAAKVMRLIESNGLKFE